MTKTEEGIALGYFEAIEGKPNQVNWVIKVETPRALIDADAFKSAAKINGWTEGHPLHEVQFCRDQIVNYINSENYKTFLASLEQQRQQQIEAYMAQMAALNNS